MTGCAHCQQVSIKRAISVICQFKSTVFTCYRLTGDEVDPRRKDRKRKWRRRRRPQDLPRISGLLLRVLPRRHLPRRLCLRQEQRSGMSGTDLVEVRFQQDLLPLSWCWLYLKEFETLFLGRTPPCYTTTWRDN